MIAATFTRLERTLPKNNAIEYTKRNIPAMLTTCRETGEQYARIFYIPTSIAQDGPATPAYTIFRNIGASGATTPPAWLEQMNLIHFQDESVPTQVLHMLHKCASVY